MPNGRIQPEHINSLHSIGKWLDRYGETIIIPHFKGKVKKMEYYDSGKKVPYKIDDFGLTFSIGEADKGPVDTIIRMEVK